MQMQRWIRREQFYGIDEVFLGGRMREEAGLESKSPSEN